MSLNWIKPEEFSFNSLLLMDQFMIQALTRNQTSTFNQHLAIALKYNPAVLWYFENKCFDIGGYFTNLVNQSAKIVTADELRRSEVYVINDMDTSIVYIYPELMEQLTYIKEWDPSRLLSITDFKDKKVLDLGSGTGRLALAVAGEAKIVYACEPNERLRNYLREKQKKLNINNMFVSDGVIEAIPFEDDMFDIVMAGHVIGDDYENEYKELKRVLKSGGYIIDCPGEDERKKSGPSKEMIELGFEYAYYESKLGGDVYRYWKKVIK